MAENSKLEALKELAAKIEAGDLFDTNSHVMSREAAVLIRNAVGEGDEFHQLSDGYDGDLNSASALQKSIAPECDCRLFTMGKTAWVYVPTRNAPPVLEAEAESDVLSRAWVLAIIRFKIAQEEQA